MIFLGQNISYRHGSQVPLHVLRCSLTYLNCKAKVLGSAGVSPHKWVIRFYKRGFHHCCIIVRYGSLVRLLTRATRYLCVSPQHHVRETNTRKTIGLVAVCLTQRLLLFVSVSLSLCPTWSPLRLLSGRSVSAASALTSPWWRLIQINLLSYSARHGSD